MSVLVSEQEIEKTLNRVNSLSEDNFIEDYKKVIVEQEELFKFTVESSAQFQLKKDTENAITELLYNIFSIYKDKFKKDYCIVNEKTILKVLKLRNDAEIAQADILGIDINDEDAINKDAESIFNQVNEAIQSGNTDNLTGKAKEFFEFAQKQNNRTNQRNLTEYISYYIGNDELIIDEDRPMVNMIIDTVVEAIEKQMGR